MNIINQNRDIFPKSIINIAIFNASHVTTELAGAFLIALQNALSCPDRIHIVNTFSYDDEKTLYIIICPAGLGSDKYVRGPKYYITYQLEPLFILQRETYRDFLSKAIFNWDYSLVNVKALANDALNAPLYKLNYLSPGYTPNVSALDIVSGDYNYTDEGKDVDVLFLGWDEIYERRKIIKENLYKTGLRVWFVWTLNLEGMQQAIRRAKICINIHSADIITSLETIRLNILLSNQACVVSENINDVECEIYKDNVFFVPYDKLVETCVALVNNPEMRKRKAIESYQWYKNERDWNKIVDFKSMLPNFM